jgi:hypothetical protein
MSERGPDYVWIVPKDSDLGRRLALFTPMGLQVLRREFEKRFVISIQIAEKDAPNVTNGVYVEFARYEISFDAHILLFGHFSALQYLAFHLGSLETNPPD